MAEKRVEKTRPTQTRSVEYQRLPWTVRCAECRGHRYATENRMARKYLSAGPVPIGARLGFKEQRLRPRGRNPQRIEPPPARRSHIGVTSATAHFSRIASAGQNSGITSRRGRGDNYQTVFKSVTINAPVCRDLVWSPSCWRLFANS